MENVCVVYTQTALPVGTDFPRQQLCFQESAVSPDTAGDGSLLCLRSAHKVLVVIAQFLAM